MRNNRYLRFQLPERIEHWILFVSFTLLGLTGLPQKFATSDVSQAIIAFFGGIEAIRIVHRVAATVFVLEAVYHLVVVGYKLFVRRLKPTMLPGVKDVTDAVQATKYNLGLSQEPPKLPRYNFSEKAEYWAMLWGLVLMGLTGFMLWNPILTASILPGQFIPAAKVAHGWEAVLAVVAIIIWHFYHVHIKLWNWSMIKGTLSESQMEEEHAAELEKIEAGGEEPTAIPPAVLRRRKMIYFPIATVVALIMVFGIYWLVTVEKTAILTVPPPEPGVPVFSMATPSPVPSLPATVEATASAPTEGGAAAPTTAPGGGGAAAATTWDGGISALFQTKCGACHGPAALGGLAVDSYANIMKGGATGPVIVAGDPGTSSLVALQQKGDHSGQFSPEELQLVIDWIKAGAPEK